jgi:hypothetical protein
MEAHFNLAITRYGHKWRVERRIVDQNLRPAIAITYQPMQIVKAHAFLRQVLRCPEKTLEYLKQYVDPAFRTCGDVGGVVMVLVQQFHSGCRHVAHVWV